MKKPQSFIKEKGIKARAPIMLAKTERGFPRGDFMDDLHQSECSIQESSAMAGQGSGNEGSYIWLGVDKDYQGKESKRMHLSQATVAALLPALIEFAATGNLPMGPE